MRLRDPLKFTKRIEWNWSGHGVGFGDSAAVANEVWDASGNRRRRRRRAEVVEADEAIGTVSVELCESYPNVEEILKYIN